MQLLHIVITACLVIISGCSFDVVPLSPDADTPLDAADIDLQDGATVDLVVDSAVVDQSPQDFTALPDLTPLIDLTTVPDLSDACHTNGKVDGTETDIDCGGGCARCASGKLCKIGTDCISATCGLGRCGPWIEVINGAGHTLRAYAFNGMLGAPVLVPKNGILPFYDQSLSFVPYERYDGNVQMDADGSEITCIDDGHLVPYAPLHIALPNAPIWGCKHQ